MPTYRSISLSLHSQFDIETFPEYAPEPKQNYLARGITGFVPNLIDDTASTCSVYVPVLPGSTFWISYAVEPPVPAGHYFLFKLYINGNYIVSWSAGQEDAWAGTTMFGMYESSDGDDSKKRVEKRVFSFTPPDTKDRKWKDVADIFDETARIEIKVHRASARKRVERVLEAYDQTPHAGNVRGINLVSAGRAGPEHPKRFYKFALIDPADHPFATFRYYYRTWDQLDELGLPEYADAHASADENLPVIEPQDASPRERIRGDRAPSKEPEDEFFECEEASATAVASHESSNKIQTKEEHTKLLRRRCSIRTVDSEDTKGSLTMGTTLCRPRQTSEQLRTYVPSGAPGPDTRAPEHEHRVGSKEVERNSCLDTPPRFYRLSIPPSIRLEPPSAASQSRPKPTRKSESASSTSYHPHPVIPVGDWDIRTPSPVKSARDNISTPPMEKGRERFALSFMSMLPSVWRRRVASGQSSTSSASGRDGARSVS